MPASKDDPIMADHPSFNDRTLNSLIKVLSKIFTSKNLLLLDRQLSPLINHLTTFSKLKELGKFNNLVWLDDVQEDGAFDSFTGLIVLLGESDDNLSHIQRLAGTQLKVHVIVKDLSRSFIFQLNHVLKGRVEFGSLLERTEAAVNVTSKIKVFDWKTLPIVSDEDFVLYSEVKPNIGAYFNEPLKEVNHLASSLIQVLFESSSTFKYKLKNIYGKGDHSSLFINILKDYKIPEYLNANLNSLELEFYQSRFSSNTDLVVLERNLDYSSVLFNQLIYHGLIDDLFEINFSQITNLPNDIEGEPVSKNLSNDVLYNNTLKHLNFSSSGLKLSKLAKYVQQQFKLKDNNSDNLDDIKKIVSSLGSLTLKQDLIKKHTTISEAILAKINSEYEVFLTFQNDLFENDYKSHLASLKVFINSSYDQSIVLIAVVLISIVNNGIKERDFEWILSDSMDLFGLQTALVLEKLLKYKLIRLINESSGDFLSTLGITHHNEETVQENVVGITGGQDTHLSNYALIDKYWNLHPVDEEENTIAPVEGTDEDVSLIDTYQNPSFTLPSNTVPVLYRLVESLYFRDFLKYKPTNNLKKRPNWENLSLDMFGGETVDVNIDDRSDSRDKKNGAGSNNGASTPIISTAPEYVIIAIIGGITRSEITCFKYLQEKLDRQKKNKKLLVLSSGIINNTSLLNFVTS